MGVLRQPPTMTVLAAVVVVLAATATATAADVDIVTDIDDWITSDKTEEEILDFFNQICTLADQLIPGIGATCTDFLYTNGPGIINSIVHENLNPTEICT